MNTSTPPAEIDIDLPLVQQLIATQFPEFADLRLQFLDAGWDNASFRLGADYIVRLPRRQQALHCLESEQTWLPVLAPHLPLPVPVPVRMGQPGPNYPWIWSIVPWFEGQSADVQAPRADQAPVMAQFLKALHQPATENAPINTFRGIPLMDRKEDVEARLARLRETTDSISKEIDQLWEAALQAPPARLQCWLHGDLHPRNVLTQNQQLRAVIDWGDLTSGDPATDLACIWMLFAEKAARRNFINTYQIPADLLARAKGWAVYFAAVLLETGLVDNPAHARIGRETFERLQQA